MMKRPAIVIVLAALAGCVSWADMRAENAYLQGHVDKAEALNDSALAGDPNDLHAKKLGAKIATKRGVDALEHGDTPKARAAFEKAVKLNPTDQVAQDYLHMIGRELPNLSQPAP